MRHSDNEIWKDVPNYEGYYQISNLGNVKAVQRKVEYKSGVINTHRERLLKPDTVQQKYKRVTLSKDNKTKRVFIHRLVAHVFIENPNNKPHINHIDNDPSNNRADNLEWCTPKENMEHCVRQNRQSGLGTRNYFCKHSEETILKVRAEQGVMSAQQVAVKYKMSKTNVRDIWNRKVWKHLP